MVIAAAFLLFEPIPPTTLNYVLILGTMCLMFFARIPTPFIILTGLITGIILN